MNKRMMVALVMVMIATVTATAIAAEKPATDNTDKASYLKKSTATKGGKALLTNKVNVNTATAAELTTLYRVGNVIAERIIGYRAKEGKIKNPEDLIRIKGIGGQIMDRNKDRIVY